MKILQKFEFGHCCLLLMKVTIFHIFFSIIFSGLSFAHTAGAQDFLHRDVTIKVEKVSLRKALSKLEQTAKVKFVYSPNTVPAEQPVSISATKQKFHEVLQNLLEPLGLTYQLLEGQILLLPKPAVGTGFQSIPNDVSSPVDRNISGTVSDEKGERIPGASIVLKGSTGTGTSTNANGEFSLTIPEGKGAVLTVSSVGYIARDTEITGQSVYSITLKADIKQLGEVVVVAYGTQSSKSVTSSISVVKGEVLERPLPSFDQMLQGKVPGLQVPQSTGQPGGNFDVRIRGIGSINAGSNPLYVIDGVIVSSGSMASYPIVQAGATNALAGINPNDIESISVLKDAQATSLYGSRGANGVVLVTTKKGKSGKTQFTLKTEGGLSSTAYRPEKGKPLQSAEWLMMLEEGYRNAGTFTEEQIQTNITAYGKGSGVDTDWFDLVTRTGKQSEINLSAAGGSEKTQFYLAGGYFQQNAVVKESDFDRFSGIFNLKNQATKRLSLSSNLNLSFTRTNNTNTGSSFDNPMMSPFFLRPTQKPYNTDGTINITKTGFDNFIPGTFYNPLFGFENNTRKVNSLKILGNIAAEYLILDDLKFTSRFGGEYNGLEQNQFSNPFHGAARNEPGTSYSYYMRNFAWTFTNQLDYQLRIANDSQFTIDAKLGYESQKSNQFNLNTLATGFPPTSELPLSGIAANVTDGRAYLQEYSFSSLFSNVSVNYHNRFVLSGSFRRDASSRFAPANRYGNFWSVGGAWNLEQEDFLKNVKQINALKIRSSYGRTGNANIGNYAWRQLYGFGANYNALPGGSFNNIGNSLLTWEGNNQFDAGLDITILNRRITFTADYYKRISDDMLFSLPVSLTTGFGSVMSNVGKMQNSGVELSIDAYPVRTQDFEWNVNFNITFNKNKVTKLPNGNPIEYSSYWRMEEGKAYNTFYLRQWAGVDPSNGSPLWYKDETKKETTTNYNEATRVMAGNASPKFFGGFSNSFKYKNFTLSALFAYNFGNVVLDPHSGNLMDGFRFAYGHYTKNLERWQKPGDITDVPKYVAGTTNNSQAVSSRFLYKGDFVKLRDLTLGYRVPSEVISRLGLGSLYVYARGTNFWTLAFDKKSTIDPEQGVNGQYNIDGAYLKSINVGLNIGF